MIAGNQPPKIESKPAIVIPGASTLFIFLPQDDLTQLELAECLKLLMLAPVAVATQRPINGAESIYDKLSDGAKRHFKASKVSPIQVAGQMPPGR
jgi:hypothetical protein